MIESNAEIVSKAYGVEYFPFKETDVPRPKVVEQELLKEIAIISFWKVGDDNDRLIRCTNYFEVPFPKKREIAVAQGSSDVNQVLF